VIWKQVLIIYIYIYIYIYDDKSDTPVEVADKRSYDVVRFVGDTQHRKEILEDLEFKTLFEGLAMYIERLRKLKNDQYKREDL
jgi:hypothetical protein